MSLAAPSLTSFPTVPRPCGHSPRMGVGTGRPQQASWVWSGRPSISQLSHQQLSLFISGGFTPTSVELKLSSFSCPVASTEASWQGGFTRSVRWVGGAGWTGLRPWGTSRGGNNLSWGHSRGSVLSSQRAGEQHSEQQGPLLGARHARSGGGGPGLPGQVAPGQEGPLRPSGMAQ